MLQVSCPSCSQRLKVPKTANQNQLTCPKCKGRFRLNSTKSISPSIAPPIPAPLRPSQKPEANSSDKTSQIVLILVCLFAGNLVLFLGASIFSSVSVAAFLLFVATVVEVAIWQRAAVISLVSSLLKNRKDNREASQLSAQRILDEQREIVEDVQIVDERSVSPNDRPTEPSHSSSKRSTRRNMNKNRTNEEPTVIQQGSSSTRNFEQIPFSGRAKSNSHGKKIKNIGKLPPVATFFRAQERLDLGFGEISDPLIYATSKAYKGTFDASLVDGSLPVVSQTSIHCQPLPYWPTYYDASPEQRKTYLDWLIGGRCDPHVELGYVFIYFYGLERRVLVDQEDFVIIANEMIRLLPIYGASNSFRSYSARLMWLSLFLRSCQADVPPKLLERAINATIRWTDELLDYLLAALVNVGRPVPPELAIVIAKNDHRSTSSVIVSRHEQQFTKLFESKFNERFSDGLLLKTSSRPKPIAYHPASGSLLRDSRWQEKLSTMPNALKITSQFKPLVEIWEQCIDELKAYNRVHRKSDGQLTSEVYEALPPELREDDHPEYDSWMELWERHANAEGWPLVPVSELAELKGIEPRTRLTKTQSQRIAQTASAIGIGFVPDFETTNRNYSWDEKVCLFFEEPNAERNNKTYKPASALLRLGMSIAAADGDIDQVEMEFIDSHIEESFNLSDADSKRLECLTYLLSKCPDADNSVTKSLCKNLSKSNRKLLGEFLVGIAAADQVLHPGEIRALKKAYRALEIAPSELDHLLARFAPQDLPTNESFSTKTVEKELYLDMTAIAQIMTETREVSRLLQEAMGDAEPDNQSSEAKPDDSNKQVESESSSGIVDIEPATPNNQFNGLPSRYHSFLESVLTQPSWDADQLESLARVNGQMLRGVVEAINEWSYDNFEDWLIEEGPEYHIHTGILNKP